MKIYTRTNLYNLNVRKLYGTLVQGLTNPEGLGKSFLSRASGFHMHNVISGKLKARSDKSFCKIYLSVPVVNCVCWK